MRHEKVNLNIQRLSNPALMEINVDIDQRRIAGIVLSAEQLDDLIARLAEIRSNMTPEVPNEFPHGKPTHHQLATKYFFGLDVFGRTFNLSFRSSGLGWMTFPIPASEIERMFHHLQEFKKRPVAPQSDMQH